jgi:ankyrin repeat protein
MAREGTSPPGLLKLPNEILIEIVTSLYTSDLRRLARTNRALYFFVTDYLYRYRYNSGLLACPNEIILEIVQHLKSQKERSRFAQASQRLYPITMNYVVRHNVRHGGSSLLNYASKRNLRRMAQHIIRLGGDVNTQYRGLSLTRRTLLTPLAVAAACGHRGMVRILLENGASQFIDGRRIPLAAAIFKRHEKVALMLSQEVESDEVLHKASRETTLQAACVAKLVNLVRHYLQQGAHGKQRATAHVLHDRNIALYRIIQQDASTGEFVKKHIHEDVYQIVLMLLKHGANPDEQITSRHSYSATARTIAPRHPDPRVRVLFPRTSPSPSPRQLSALIGRPWYWSDQNDHTMYGSQSESIPPEATRYVMLSDFLETSNTETQTLQDGSDFGHEEISPGDSRLDPADILELAQGETARLKKTTEAMGPPPLSAFPRLLGTSTAKAENRAQGLWANFSHQTFRAVPAVRNSGSLSVSTVPPKGKLQPNTTEADPFPRLVRSGPAPKDPAKEIWANLQRNRTISNKGGNQGMVRTVPPEENINGKEGSANKSMKKMKKKKWQPLLM